ncbi:MAG: hypothetical protein ACLU8D_01670 [Enterocloster sp.]
MTQEEEVLTSTRSSTGRHINTRLYVLRVPKERTTTQNKGPVPLSDAAAMESSL